MGLTNRRQSVTSLGDGEIVTNSIVSYGFKDQLPTVGLLACVHKFSYHSDHYDLRVMF